MNLFRIVDEKYSSFYDVYSGTGASLYGGRWSPLTVHAIYLSKTIEVAVCEKGYYAIINNAYTLFKKTNLTASDKSLLLNRKYYLTSAKFNLAHDGKNDLTDKKKLSGRIATSSLVGNYLPSDSIFSPWEDLPDRWTVKVGSTVFNDFEDSLKCLSARKTRGRNIVVFNDSFDLTKISGFTKREVFLSACSSNNKSKWNGKGKFSLTHVHYEIPTSSISGVVEVINKQI